jgi:ribonucleoside-diphosphate reductase alpha chain
MMDNVVDASRFPLEAQAREAHAKRRIGLGVTGLADALAMVGLRYGSPEAAERTGRMDGGDRARPIAPRP